MTARQAANHSAEGELPAHSLVIWVVGLQTTRYSCDFHAIMTTSMDDSNKEKVSLTAPDAFTPTFRNVQIAACLGCFSVQRR